MKKIKNFLAFIGDQTIKFFSFFADWRVIFLLFIGLTIIFYACNDYLDKQAVEKQKIEAAWVQNQVDAYHRNQEAIKAERERIAAEEAAEAARKTYTQSAPAPTPTPVTFTMPTPIDTSVPELIPFEQPTFNSGIPDGWPAALPHDYRSRR